MFAKVAIPKSAPDALTYSIPDDLVPFAVPGVRVRVPLRKKIVTGVLVEVSPTADIASDIVRPLHEVVDQQSLLPGHLFHVADFISSYYRSPLGDTLAAMLPAGLLRSDGEIARLTPAGAGTDPEALSGKRGKVLSVLQSTAKIGVPALLARAGAVSRGPLDALVEAGLATVRSSRRDRSPEAEVTAVKLPDTPIEELLERCSRAPRRREILEWLAEQGRPALASEVCGAVGCSPSTLRAMDSAGLLLRFRQPAPRKPRWVLKPTDTRHRLTAEQQLVVDAVGATVNAGEYAPFLLEGITGSGKTEVYLRCLEQVLERGQSGLVLVPEIGLTPAASGAVERRFGSQAAILHSALSEGERWREWKRIRDGRARIVVGPRSAIFAPFDNLGLIVVDEEHDAAYKQQETPRYHARDLSLVTAQHLGVPVILCSATPSVESSALVERGLARHLRLTRRVAGGQLPEVELVDLRGEPPEPGEQGRTLFSRRLRELLEETVERGEQAILLMQRRGWAPILLCRDCGHRIECPSCSVSLVVHRRSGDLRCHYCDHQAASPHQCPSCAGKLLDAVGAGTEKVAHHLDRLFPGVTSAILDRDTVRRRSGLQETLGAFASGAVQVLIGTQMVAKGHHFPNVTLTGVISADAMLGLPDFRAGERTFQLLTQVAGRSGRGDRPGRVVIQTYYPDHPAVRLACQHDVTTFLEEEILFRRGFDYPPVTRLALVRFEAANERLCRTAAEAAAAVISPLPDRVRLRGPAPAPLERIRNQWRWQLLISAANRELLRGVLEKTETLKVPRNVRRVIDVDPASTL
ncbi:MAG: primosomal protein N' [Acidobacteria bacterium]|nr:primosomal protein N' [Acidobacteriota bacterium]